MKYLTATLLNTSLLFTAAFFATSAIAEDSEAFFKSKSSIGIGAAYQTASADLRATAGDLPEVAIDLDDLGMDREDWSWALEGRWRFKPKWMLVALAYQFDQDGSRETLRDFNFDGKEFQAGASLDTEIKINTYILDVMYKVYNNDRSEIYVGGGIHAIDLEASITGRAFVADAERERATGSSEILAPLPNLRAQGFYAINGQWGLAVAMGWLSANYEDYDGSFAYIHPRLAYAFSEHWSVTAGYQYVDIDLTHEKSSNRESEFNMDFKGPTLFMNYRF
ncbi:MAG: outer membrane beta-barrel protein [Halioglobus sp.]